MKNTVLAGLLLLVAPLTFADVAPAPLVSPPGTATPLPYVGRGNEVERKYGAYTARLHNLHQKLLVAIKAHAPVLAKELSPEPPKPVVYGYQVLPKIVRGFGSDDLVGTTRAVSSNYSWPKTEQYIGWELAKIDTIDENIAALPQLTEPEQKAILSAKIEEYKTLESNQRLIDSHFQYNRLWQQAIAEDRARFEKLTRLHNATLERQAILDALSSVSDAEFISAIATLSGIDRSRSRDAISIDLKSREQNLAELIRSEAEDIVANPNLKLSTDKQGLLVSVPIYTDILDKKFLTQFQTVVESTWKVEKLYRVKIKFLPFDIKKAYAKIKKTAPHAKEHLDLQVHETAFPKDGVVLTTGANSTYALPSRLIALGPQEMTENVIAHEFGHLLGFVDTYFRGFRDLGADGFEVLEIVPDPDDIMCTPSYGKVRAHHFERLQKKNAPLGAPTTIAPTAQNQSSRTETIEPSASPIPAPSPTGATTSEAR